MSKKGSWLNNFTIINRLLFRFKMGIDNPLMSTSGQPIPSECVIWSLFRAKKAQKHNCYGP